jgi:hypothetical protein
MENQTNKDQLIAYLEGTLTAPEIMEVEEKLAKDTDYFTEYDQLRIIYESLENAADFEAPTEISTNFYSHLSEAIEAEKNTDKYGKAGKAINFIKSTWNSSLSLRIAASVALFLAGFFIDKQINIEQLQTKEVAMLRNELNTTKTLVMLSLLKQQSASDRIMAVNYTYDMQEVDKRIIEALSETLATDENPNVRMAACEALVHYKSKPEVQEVLLNTLANQQDPGIQVIIIDALIELEDPRAVASLQELIETQEVIDLVKNKAQEGIGKLM